MPVRNSKKGGGRTARSPQRRAGKTTATKAKGKVRGFDSRREAALAEARAHEEKLNAWIAAQAAAPEQGYVNPPVSGIVPVIEEPEPAGQLIEVVFTTGIISDPMIDILPMDADSIGRRMDWPLGDARHLVRTGYAVEHVMQITGWPESELKDVKVGRW